MSVFFRKLSAWCALALFPSMTVCAGTIVRMETSMGNIDVELYDQSAPLTVQNFLNYVRGGDYVQTLIHRSVPGFVIQGGGYAISESGVASVLEDSPVRNEFSPERSNVRGTIAMAKVGGDPDSATSQWFFNLADNSANLDNQNGGFTVFGEVVNDGMKVVDAIAAAEVISLDIPMADGSGLVPFNELPIKSRPEQGSIKIENLVVVDRVLIPGIVALPVSQDFGPVAVGASRELVIGVRNQSASPSSLTLGGTDPLEGAFSLAGGTCGDELPPASSCELRLRFSPPAAGGFAESFSLDSDDPDYPVTYIRLSGEGVASPVQLDPADLMSFEDVAIGDSLVRSLTLKNVGDSVVTLTVLGIEGEDAADFSLAGDCSVLNPDDTCILDITFSRSSAASAAAVLRLSTDVAALPSIEVKLQAEKVGRKLEVLDFRFSGEIDRYDFRDILLTDGGSSTGFRLGNAGVLDLTFDSIELLGPDVQDFTMFHDCEDRLLFRKYCTVTLIFLPLSEGFKEVVVRIVSDDPDRPVVEIPVTAFARQAWNLVSLDREGGDVLQLVTYPSVILRKVREIEPPAPEELPAGVRFEQGVLDAEIELPQGVVSTAVGMILPEGAEPVTYYKYGPTPDNAVPHWYEFMWDGETGAVIEGNRIMLYFVDGKRGDDDLLVNGVISDPGGPAFDVLAASDEGAAAAGEGNGSGGGCTLVSSSAAGRPGEWLAVLAFIAWLGLRRRFAMSRAFHPRARS